MSDTPRTNAARDRDQAIQKIIRLNREASELNETISTLNNLMVSAERRGMEKVQSELAELKERLKVAEQDSKRLDWLCAARSVVAYMLWKAAQSIEHGGTI